ncbi:BadF/BadG/BcrA/BcrD ATPase family protein [Sulfitobacter sp. JB4-11]|uniref:BadF/BadG/BcrA/BcrD ATPase family protein n=1 Tax=Sulfitobacter rhodophyticola TaxID=3238304 RepID=UPI003516461D
MSAAQQRIVVAVDGGGTGCRAAVGTLDAGIIAQAEGAPANVATGFEAALANVTAVVSRALAHADLADAPLDQITAHVGVAGANSQADMARVAAALPYGTCSATGDRETTVVGALGDADGFVIALGTGTIIARQHEGAVRTVGGWGFKLSDQAAGAWLGRRLLEEVLLAEDGMRDHSTLTQSTLARYGSLYEIVDFAATAAPGAYAELALHVVPAAHQSDPVAVALMQEGATHLERGLDALGFADGNALSLAGGLGPKYEPWLAERYRRNLVLPRGTALQGAYALACKAARVPA